MQAVCLGKESRHVYRAVGEEDAVGVHLQDLGGRVVGGDDRQAAVEARQPPQDVVLDAKVVRHNLRCKDA